ncbi:MAG: hypothetical protein K2X77_17340 [Candidatus Obscuribacterales bacterium]|nr:hypothetical protein [Candidatus Obscuribacterales bacterium]
MGLDWLKDKADKAIKTVGEAGTSLLNEAQSLGESAVKKIKSIAGSDEQPKSEAKVEAKPADSTAKPAEKKSDETKPVEKKSETAGAATAKLETNTKYEQGLIADAQAIAEAVKKTVQQDLGFDTVKTVLSTIYDYASVPIKAATDPVGTISKIAGLEITSNSTKIGRSVGLFDTTNENVKVVVLSDEVNDRLKNAAQEMQKKALEATSKKGGDEEQRQIEEAQAAARRQRGGFCGPKETIGEVCINNIYDQVKDGDGKAKLTVKDEDGKETEIEVPEAALRFLTKTELTAGPEAQERPVDRVGLKEDKYTNEFRHAFTNEKGERTETFTLPGRIQAKKFDRDGNLITSLDKTNEQTTLTHKGETATKFHGKTKIEGKDYKAFIDDKTGDVKVKLPNGIELSLENGETKAKISKTNMDVISKPGETRVTNVAGKDAYFMSGHGPTASQKVEFVTKQVQENLKPGQSAFLAGPGFNRIVYENATLDKFASDNSWVLKTQGKTYVMWNEDGKFFVKHNGETTEIKNDEAGKNIVEQLKADTNGAIKDIRDGMMWMVDKTTANFQTGDVVLQGENHERATVRLNEDGTKLTAASNVVDPNASPADAVCKAPTSDSASPTVVGSLIDILRNSADNTAPVSTNCSTPDSKMLVTFMEMSNNNDGKLIISNPTEVQSSVVADTSSFLSLVQSTQTSATQTPAQELPPGLTPIEVKTQPLMEVNVQQAEIRVPATNTSPAVAIGPDGFKNETTGTTIDRQGNVKLGHDGPTLHRDGSVRIDRDTHVSADMKVVSRGWESTAAQTRGPISEAQAQSIAATVSGKANAAYTKALGSVVRWSEVADLNCALSDIVSMMGLIPPGSPAYSLLMKSYGLIMQALSVAAPKAQLAEKAITAGVTDQNQIKKFEVGGWGALVSERRAVGLR